MNNENDTKINEKELTTEQLTMVYNAMMPHISSIAKRADDFDFLMRVANELHSRGALPK